MKAIYGTGTEAAARKTLLRYPSYGHHACSIHTCSVRNTTDYIIGEEV